MNANLGLVLRAREREALLRPLPRSTRTWGSETVEIGEQRFSFPGLDDVEFEIYPVTQFILSKLPVAEQTPRLEYAWMTGRGLDRYQAWAEEAGPTAAPTSFERAFESLLGQLSFWAVMLAPEGDRLEQFMNARADDIPRLLRTNVGSLSLSRGFLAVRA